MAKLKITLVRSVSSANKRQKAVLQALGLRKIGQTVELEDLPSTRGSVRKVEHMLTCEEA